MSDKLAVIDTETTWSAKVMSLGVVVGSADRFELLGSFYCTIVPHIYEGGMYTYALYAGGLEPDFECALDMAIEKIDSFLLQNNISRIFAYNASFDLHLLKELSHYEWYDIMKVAAYRQFNSKIPKHADCYKTGRLKRNYGVEEIYRMLSEDKQYFETHNALFDAMDELKIMKMLNQDISIYPVME